MNSVLKLIILLFIPIIFSSAHAMTIVCIVGGTGAGKTTIAQKLVENMGDRVAIISQDSYYKDLSHLTKDERKKINFDHPNSIEFDLLRKHLLQLKKGEVIEVPNYDFITSNRTKEFTTVAPKDILILEGILLLAVPEIRELVDIKIFVDVEDDVRLLRRIKRDVEERGRTISNVQNQYLATVRPMHQEFVAPSKQYADIIIPHGAENIVAVDLLLAQLREIAHNINLAKGKKSDDSLL